ncbi:MAG: double-strand break repair helicase AddA [Rhodospirillales bacterium]|nr:double-strand break repair helicase AddA [Rhodospirillales bacterium]
MSNLIQQQAEEAQRRASDPKASVWVAASAGTGKTKVLTDRVLSLLLDAVRPERILCLTFTKAAAAEMSTRIAERLSTWASREQDSLAAELNSLLGKVPSDAVIARARRLFVQVLDTPGGMHIQTIHAFCQSLLGRFPLEADLAPHFTVMDERDAAEMLLSAQETMLQQSRQGRDDKLAQALAVIAFHRHESAFPELMRALASERGRIKRLIANFGGVDGVIEKVEQLLEVAPGEDLDSLLSRACAEEAFDGSALREAAGGLLNGSKTDQERGGLMAAWLADMPEGRLGQLQTYTGVFLTGKGETRKTLMTKKAAEAAPSALDALETEAERLVRLEYRKKAIVTAQATSALLRLADALLAEYERRKTKRALLDYDDLILKARDLLKKPGVAPWVLYKLDGGIEHVLVDEAQDTNPDQWQVVEALTGEFFAGQGIHESTRTVFAVGDAKQSIYSFQRADPAEFARMREQFSENIKASGEEWREVPLTVSFRSTSAVLEAVDQVFSPDHAAQGVALDGRLISHQAWRVGQAGLVELWPPVVPKGGEEQAPWKPPVEPLAVDSPRARLAKLLAAKISSLVNGSETLESQGRAITPGDILVLVRRRSGFVEELVRELKQSKVAVAGADRMVLTEQMAVMDLIALGRFLLLPEDDLTLATILKGPLCGLDEEQLFTLAYNRKGTLYGSLREKAAGNVEFANALDFLTNILAKTDRMPPFELFSYVLNGLEGWRKLQARLGPDAEDPINEFMDLALSYERSHIPTLEGFLFWLEQGEIQIKRDLDQGNNDAVRIMTVHGAKGLQASVVFLPDTLQVPKGSNELLWPQDLMLWPPKATYSEEIAEQEKQRRKQLMDEEHRRLLYVAMTRAEDRLYVCGWGMKTAPSDKCWYRLIETALGGFAEEADDFFLESQGETETSQVLRYSSAQTVRAAENQITQESLPPLAALPEWATSIPPKEPTPSNPLMPSKPEEEPSVQSPFVANDTARFLRGQLIHRLLETLPGIAPEQRERTATKWLEKSGKAFAEKEQQTLVAEVLAVLETAEYEALFGPSSRAEVPIVGEVNGHVVSGRIDRLVVQGDEVFIVDYKTNRPPPIQVEDVAKSYLRQMAIYRSLVAQIYQGKQVRCLLLWTDGPRLMELPNNILDIATP